MSRKRSNLVNEARELSKSAIQNSAKLCYNSYWKSYEKDAKSKGVSNPKETTETTPNCIVACLTYHFKDKNSRKHREHLQ